jgi:hypothetical protein
MSVTKQSWQPCFADPWRGVAHFDGLTIEADPITSARPNRVLPCIADEQVLFCRMLRALVPEASNKFAIDLGTGSGVLALYAASLGMRVRGVDCCPRALEFARYNERQNQALLEKAGGSVAFLKADYTGEECKPSLGGTADYVFLNPPFSPCLPGCEPPLSANGGEAGQDAFLQALPVAFSSLREQGSLFVVHLLLTDGDGSPKEDLAACTGSGVRWSSIRIFPALVDGPIPAQKFLNSQYRALSDTKAQLQSHAENDHFCLAFMEFRKGEPLSSKAFEIASQDANPLASLPNWKWEERLRMHRSVSENRSKERAEKPNAEGAKANTLPNQTRFPGIGLFLQRTNPILGLGTDSTPSELSDRSSILTKTQNALDGWIRSNAVLDMDPGTDFPVFDCIMVEAAPWHLAQRRLALRTETAIWARESHEENPSSVALALRRVQREIERFHYPTEPRSIFLHRELLSDTGARLWQEAISVHQYESASDKTEAPLPSKSAETADRPYCSEGLQVTSAQHELGKFGIKYVNPSTLPFDECLRRALHAYTCIMREEGLLTLPDSQCYFLALPMPLPQPASQQGSSGVVYVYAWSSRHWSPVHESFVADLGRTASFLYEESYSEKTRSELEQLYRHSFLVSAAHEMKPLVDKIGCETTDDLSDILKEIIYLHFEFRPLGKRLELARKTLSINTKLGFQHLAVLAYLFQVLYYENKVESALVPETLEQMQRDATSLISIENVSGAPRKIDVSEKIFIHFAAGLIAGLRNAIYHCRRGNRSDPKIILSIEEGCVLITNSFCSVSNNSADVEGLRKKQAEQADDPQIGGTEISMRYHERQMLTRMEIDSTTVARIQPHSSLQTGNGSYLNTWKTFVRLPLKHTISFV